VTNASDWKAGARLDYVIDDGVGVFALGNFERNTFAGFKWYFEEAAGLAATLVNGGGNLLKTEVGASLNQQRSLTDSTNSFIAARVAATYRRNLTDAAYVQEEASALPNLQQTKDLRINSETSLVAPISKRIAVKMSYAIRFDNLPEPGFKKTDRIFTSGLQIVF
jgi:putative salt-induced outer membrane protein